MKNLLLFADRIDPVSGDTIKGDDASGALNNIIINVINAILGVVGLVAVVMVILGGISYMTSAGDSSKVKKGKDTILYGVIGLIIVGLAFAIVNFVIANIINVA
ncbi:hypothetical protein IKX64_00260 [Candidatus Saccharibacteria bacterium]|nr:hypothetical protein [Candidatus Saccharibacteria bacterium]